MKINIVQNLQRSERHRANVRDEVFVLQNRFGPGAHDAALKKLGRPNLTSKYRAVLGDVERALRPRKSGLLSRLGLRRI